MLIALTGGIASGKSTVAEIWRNLGALVIDADELAREVVEIGKPGLAKLVEVFGESILNPDGSLNRKRLGDIVFSNVESRRQVEEILHPLISAEFERQASASATEHVVYAIPLLVESNGKYRFDRICTISAPEAVRVGRLVRYRGFNEADAWARVRSQVDDGQREQIADVVIQSDCTLSELEASARAAWKELTRETSGDSVGT